ncbi:Prolyl 3-hydroxylase 2 [Holothuria leucospilota]|uniref:procollagen-proline 3-dioxygenase n=1 Tax=Holothuria leucospilota TaxID=206669 RepID=A0A9Q1CP98_HOLLE|nr:Prolyl 3-hydroxylase 2 [Holothuria leucospilota]
MRLIIIMAQTISIFTTLFVFLVTYCLFCTVRSHLQIVPGTTYDELYSSAIDSYNEENWENTIFFMENAIREFKFYRVKLTECRVHCQNLSLIVVPEEDEALSELKFFQGIFKKAACLKTCKSAKLGNRAERISEEATMKFLTLMPYSYLQFAYYKQKKYYDAQCAAYTYLRANPDDEVMKNNLDYYYNVYGAENETLVDLEERLHQKYYLEGNSAHEVSNYTGVIEHFEEALKFYWWAYDECRALCEGQYDSREFLDLYESIAGHYAYNLHCKEHCNTTLATIGGEVIPNYLASHYHYLQYAYYKLGKIQEAVDCAATYILLKPDDEVMRNNMAFYEEALGVSKYKIRIRPRAQAYWDRCQLEKEVLDFAKKYFWEEIEEDKVVLQDYGDAEPIDPNEVRLKDGVVLDDKSGDEEDDDDDEEEDMMSKRGDMGSVFELGQDDMGVENQGKDLTVEESGNIENNDEDDGIMDDVGGKEEEGDNDDGNDDDDDDYEEEEEEEEKDEEEEEKDEEEEDEEEEEGDGEDFYDYPEEDLDDDDDYFEPERPEISLKMEARRKKMEEEKKRENDEGDSKEDGDDENLKFYEKFKTTSEMVKEEEFQKRLRKKDEPRFPRGPSKKEKYEEDLVKLYNSAPNFDMVKKMASETSRVPYPSLAGIELHRSPQQLMGLNRVAVDGMASPQECDTLIRLLHEEAIYGDGYEGRTDPHTPHEKYEGITVKDAVEAAAGNRVPLYYPATFIYLAERSRAFVQRFFGLSTHLYFSYTHLVCRETKPGAPLNRTDFSHPIHADNCIIDHKRNICHKMLPAFTWRDWSSVLYLNDGFEGGNFMFANFDNTSQVEVEPTCGRLVAFAGEELHAVRPVLEGQRCALAMWYTLDPLYQELDMFQSLEKIESILKLVQRKEAEQKLEEQELQQQEGGHLEL